MNITVSIVGAARTPIGRLYGSLSHLKSTYLGGIAIKGAIEGSGIAQEQIEELYMGCVLPAGQGQAPARQAGLAAGLPVNIPATTVNKMCGSGMKAVMFGYDQIITGSCNAVIAGGMESMSNAPYLLPKSSSGTRLGHSKIYDHLFLDGLEDAYEEGRLMGEYAEECAGEYQFTRTSQNDYAIESYLRARKAQKSGAFMDEIQNSSISSPTAHNNKLVDCDEEPPFPDLDKVSSLKSVFIRDGTITAASSSKISDGAAAIALVRTDLANLKEMNILGNIVAHACVALKPAEFPIAPIHAVKNLLKKTEWTVDSVDLWEVNEAFAVVPMAFMHEIGIQQKHLNINGGACALGHPIGASGARIIATLVHAMHNHNVNRGIAAICIGGGEATAIAIERN